MYRDTVLFPSRHTAVLLALVFSVLLFTPVGARARRETAGNGGFENGMQGWMWEQWLGKPQPGVVDHVDHDGGMASFRMGLPGTAGGRWLAREFPIRGHERDYVFSFRWKLAGVPDGAARVRLAVPNRGFLGGGDLARAGGTQDWTPYRFVVPASQLRDADKVTVFFYDDAMDAGAIGIDAVSVEPAARGAGAATLTGDTSHADTSTFIVGQPVSLTFSATNISAPETLRLSIMDAHRRPIAIRTLRVYPDQGGHWQTKVAVPHDRLGFYRVYARLSDGTELLPLGSRPAGFLTYAVVPDPAKRVNYGEAHSLFGMQCPMGPEANSLLGFRWILDDAVQWRATEPDHAGQFGPDQQRRYVRGTPSDHAAYKTYTLPTLFVAPHWAVKPETLMYNTGTLTPDGEKAWADYCRAAAHAYAQKNPGRTKRIYQITWEPIQPWGFKGTDADLIQVYRIAYPAIHAADPEAVVAGPCRGIYNNGDPQATASLLKQGLGRYMDAYICHNYYSITPEKDGMPRAIRDMKAMLHAATGRDVPMYGSEQGWPTDEDPSKELQQAQGLIRQCLISLGEGFRFNFGFTYYDYRMSGSRTGYGYYYNLSEGVPFGPSKICPKPIGPAYAAMTLLIDGSTSATPIEWLGKGICGCAFERGSTTTLALWNYGDTPRDLVLATGVRRVHVFDWMGNERTVDTPHDRLMLKQLGPEPVYVVGVSSLRWGAVAARLLRPDVRRIDAYPGDRISVSGSLQVPPGAPAPVRLAVEPDAGDGLQPQRLQVRAAAGRATPFRLKITLPSSLRPGVRALQLRLQDASGNTITARTLTVDVLPPLAVRTEAAWTSRLEPAIALTLQETRGRAVAGRLAVRLKEILPGAERGDAPAIDLVTDPGKTGEVPGTAEEIPFRLAAGGVRRWTIALGNARLAAGRRYQIVTTVTGANGASFLETAPVTYLAAARFDHPPTIDGDLSEWICIPAVRLIGPRDVVRSPQFYAPALAATLRYAWDDHAMYVAADVQDDVFQQRFTGVDIWRQDCLQLAFNLDPTVTDNVPNAARRRVSEINVALTPDGPQAYRGFSSQPEQMPIAVLSAADIQLSVKRAENGRLVYEMAIPWTTLGLSEGRLFQPGDTIGVAATVNEVRRDGQGDPCALGMFGGITPDKDPDKFGRLMLSRRPAAAAPSPL